MAPPPSVPSGTHARRAALQARHQSQVARYQEYTNAERAKENNRINDLVNAERAKLEQRLRHAGQSLYARHLDEEREFWNNEARIADNNGIGAYTVAPTQEHAPVTTAATTPADSIDGLAAIRDQGAPYPPLPPVEEASSSAQGLSTARWPPSFYIAASGLSTEAVSRITPKDYLSGLETTQPSSGNHSKTPRKRPAPIIIDLCSDNEEPDSVSGSAAKQAQSSIKVKNEDATEHIDPLPEAPPTGSLKSTSPESIQQTTLVTSALQSQETVMVDIDNTLSERNDPQKAIVSQSTKAKPSSNQSLQAQYPRSLQLLSPAPSVLSQPLTPNPFSASQASPLLSTPQSPTKSVKRKEHVLSDSDGCEDGEDGDWEPSEPDSPVSYKRRVPKDSTRPTKKAKVKGLQKKPSPRSMQPPKSNKFGSRRGPAKPNHIEKHFSTPPRRAGKDISTPSAPSKPIPSRFAHPKTPATPTPTVSNARAAAFKPKPKPKGKAYTGTKIDPMEVEELTLPVLQPRKRKTAIAANDRIRNVLRSNVINDENDDDDLSDEAMATEAEESDEREMQKLPGSMRRMSLEPRSTRSARTESFEALGLLRSRQSSLSSRPFTSVPSFERNPAQPSTPHRHVPTTSLLDDDEEVDISEYEIRGGIIIHRREIDELDLTIDRV